MATLFDLAQAYLNQSLPSIDPIFPNTGITYIKQPIPGSPSDDITTQQEVGLTPDQLALLYPQNQGGRNDPVNTGFGDFNNLDQTDVRYEVVNGELVPTYRNVTSGLYQTESGKNVTNLGLNLPFSNFLKGIFGSNRTSQYPGYFEQDPATRGTLADYLTGKTRKDQVEQFRIDQIEKDSNISGVEDPSDYLQRQKKIENRKKYADVQRDIFRARHSDNGGNITGSVSTGGTDDTPGTPF